MLVPERIQLFCVCQKGFGIPGPIKMQDLAKLTNKHMENIGCTLTEILHFGMLQHFQCQFSRAL